MDASKLRGAKAVAEAVIRADQGAAANKNDRKIISKREGVGRGLAAAGSKAEVQKEGCEPPIGWWCEEGEGWWCEAREVVRIKYGSEESISGKNGRHA